MEWLLWALFSTSREETDVHEYEEEMNGYIEALEMIAGEKFQDGHSRKEGVRSMRINQDPVVMVHRPLVWYFVCVPYSPIQMADFTSRLLVLLIHTQL